MNISRTFVIRFLMVLSWIGLIGIFFYSPLLLQGLRATKSINVLIWPVMLDVKKIAQFEQKTGIKVQVSYYESNEELLRKFQVTGGKGYDLVIAADYSIEQLKGDGLLQPVDRAKLSFFNDLNPLLLHHYFDKENAYSVPYYLGIYGLGIDRPYFEKNPTEINWTLLFKPSGYRVTMTDDPRRAIMLAALYEYGSAQDLHTRELLPLQRLLVKQKKSVELYSDVRGEEVLAAKSCPVVLTISPDLWRMQREFKQLDFVIPAQGSFMVLDSFVIPRASSQQDFVYQLLNYLYQPEIIKHNATRFGFCPPITTVNVQGTGIICPTRELMKKLSFFNSNISKQALNAVWINVMAN